MVKVKLGADDVRPEKVCYQGSLLYPLVRRTLVIDHNDWRWLQSHRDAYRCKSVSQLLRILINLERTEKRHAEDIIRIATVENTPPAKTRS